jgi:seryl-tRNA synthetase
MLDRIEELEQKIAALVEKINVAKSHIAELQRQNYELLRIVEEKKVTDQENVRLQERIRELEQEINAREDKETAARERLKAILNRIDALESEITQLHVGPQNE